MSVNLYLHNRTIITGKVSDIERDGLVRVFGDGGSSTPPVSDAERVLVQQFLRHVRNSELWIACSCKGTAAPPLMSPRLRNGELHIWRHGTVHHANDCPLRMTGESSAGKGASETSVKSGQQWEGKLLLLAAESERTPARPHTRSPGNERATTPFAQYDRLLSWLVEHADLNKVHLSDTMGGKEGVRATYAAFDLLNQLPVCDGLEWKDVSCNYLPALVRHCIKLRTTKDKFPQGVRPQGYFFGVVDAIEPNGHLGVALVKNAAGKDIRHAIVGSVSGDRPERGPFLVLASIAEQRDTRRFDIWHAHAIGCLSKRILLPVRTESDRLVARVLLDGMRLAHAEGKIGLDAALEMPLVPSTSGPRQPLFRVWLREGKSVAVFRTVSEDRSWVAPVAQEPGAPEAAVCFGMPLQGADRQVLVNEFVAYLRG